MYHDYEPQVSKLSISCIQSDQALLGVVDGR